MTRPATFALLAPLAAAILGFAPVAAAAEGGIYTCAPDAPPSETLTCVAAQPGAEPPVVRADRSLKERTHNWLVPTGKLLRAGDAEVNLHELIYVDTAIGITDNFELNASTPIIPAFATVGARLGLTPQSSPWHLVLGGTVWFPVMAYDSDSFVAVAGTATAAYQGDRFGIHGTMAFVKPLDSDSVDESGSSSRDAVGISTIGMTLKLGRTVALIGELAQVIVGDREHADRYAMSALGLKFMGATTDVDVGFVFHEEGALPMVSAHYRF